MLYQIATSKTGSIQFRECNTAAINLPLSSTIMICIKNFSDENLEEIFDELSEIRSACIMIADMSGLTKEGAEMIEKLFRMRFPFRNCIVERTKSEPKNILQIYNEKQPDLCLLDEQTFLAATC